MGLNELRRGGNAFLHHSLHRAKADDAARTLGCLHFEMEKAPSIVANNTQPDDLADPRRTRQSDFLLALGIGQLRRDRLPRLSQFASENDRAILPWGH